MGDSSQRKRKADLKVVLLGESSVGKTCLVHRYLTGSFEDAASTIGASFFLRQWGKYNAAIWDTAGEERFHGLSAFYCRCAGAAILAFDPMRAETFEDLKVRHLPLLEAAEPACLVLVVSTKNDLVTPQNRRVSAQEGIELATTANAHNNVMQSGVPYFETSSLTGQNVSRVFEFIFSHCLGSAESTSRAGSPSVGSASRGRTALRHDVVMLHDGSETPQPETKKCC